MALWEIIKLKYEKANFKSVAVTAKGKKEQRDLKNDEEKLDSKGRIVLWLSTKTTLECLIL